MLLVMRAALVERGLCLRQPTDKGNLLVFPSFYRRERPEQVKSPAVLVNYQFTGFLDEVYATLVVRLHHAEPFQRDQLWRNADDFKTNTGKQLGVKLTRRATGLGELEVYFDPAVAMEEKIISGEPEQGTRAGGRGYFHGGSGGPDQPRTHGQRSGD